LITAGCGVILIPATGKGSVVTVTEIVSELQPLFTADTKKFVEDTAVVELAIVWLMLVPLPPVPLPVHDTTLVPMQGVSAMLKGSPEQVVNGFGEAVTSGVSFIVITFAGIPVSIFPHASVIKGGGTDKTVIVSQVHGQEGIVRFNSLRVVPAEHPAAVPATMLPVIQG
jgi:hypothetical protein